MFEESDKIIDMALVVAAITVHCLHCGSTSSKDPEQAVRLNRWVDLRANATTI